MKQNQSSLEVKAMLECNDKLVIAFSSEPKSLYETLLTQGLIASELHEQMFVHSDIINTFKASKLVEGVRKSIEIAPNKFKEFLEILQKKGSTHDCADILSLKYIELNNVHMPVIKSAAKDHDKRQHVVMLECS
jgi:hypothetical protein